MKLRFAPLAALAATVILGLSSAQAGSTKGNPIVTGSPEAAEAMPEVSTMGPSVDEYLAVRDRMFASLSQNFDVMRGVSGIRVTLGDTDIQEMDSKECRTCGEYEASTFKMRVGINKTTAHTVDFSDMAGLRSVVRPGTTIKDGGVLNVKNDRSLVWNTAVTAEGASAVRLHLTNFSLPAGAELYVYNSEGEAYGPYTDLGPNGDGEVWTNTVVGDRLFIELRTNRAATADALSVMGFTVQEVGVMGENFLPAVMGEGNSRTHCSYNATCVEDATCYSGTTITSLKAAVGFMVFTSGGGQYICSGGLVNDTVAATQIPYFLTANHCISKSAEANSLEVYWKYQTTSCRANCDTNAFYTVKNLGATIKKTNRTGDYTLLQLKTAAPTGATFLGWTATAVANTNGTALYRVSHPQGAPQAWSTHTVSTTAGTCTGWPRGSWIYSKDTLGATEGGSSGSPVVNASAQIVGQLSGGCGTQLNNVCNRTANSTVDGAFASYFTAVKPYLNP